MKHPTLAYNIDTVACSHYIAHVKYMYLSTSCIQALKFSVFCASVNTYIGKVVSKNFSKSLYMTCDMRMMLGPLYFAWGDICFGVSVYLLCKLDVSALFAVS